MFDNFEPEPDRWDRLIRFALGFVAGTISGAVYLPHWRAIGDYVLLLAVAEGLLLGWMAARYGDRAWQWFRDRWFD